VEPIRVVGVNARLGGEILELAVQEGDRVDQGRVLARLDDRELKAERRSAEAAYEVAQAALQRAEKLLEAEIVTQAEYERDRSAFAAAEARLDQLDTRLEYATIRSPLRGVVTEKMCEVGDIVATQARLFTIADVSTMVVRVAVSELDVVELAAGDEVNVTLDALPDTPFTGHIRRIFPTADPTSRLVPVEVALGGDGVARAGFLARVTFDLDARENVVLVPQAALQGAGTQEFVFVVEDDRAVRRPVGSGLTSRGLVEVRTNLDEGELVVVSGQNLLRDGAPVRVVEPAGERATTLEGAPQDSESATSPGGSR
jgi:RND family efflux transporter MFP subunit